MNKIPWDTSATDNYTKKGFLIKLNWEKKCYLIDMLSVFVYQICCWHHFILRASLHEKDDSSMVLLSTKCQQLKFSKSDLHYNFLKINCKWLWIFITGLRMQSPFLIMFSQSVTVFHNVPPMHVLRHTEKQNMHSFSFFAARMQWM